MGYDLYRIEWHPTKVNRNYDFHEVLEEVFCRNDDQTYYIDLESDEWKELENKCKGKFDEELQQLREELESTEHKSANFSIG